MRFCLGHSKFVNNSVSILFNNIFRSLQKWSKNFNTRQLLRKKSLLASVHILTLPNYIKAANEIGEIASEKVNEHFFNFGKDNDTFDSKSGSS